VDFLGKSFSVTFTFNHDLGPLKNIFPTSLPLPHVPPAISLFSTKRKVLKNREEEE